MKITNVLYVMYADILALAFSTMTTLTPTVMMVIFRASATLVIRIFLPGLKNKY